MKESTRSRELSDEGMELDVVGVVGRARPRVVRCRVPSIVVTLEASVAIVEVGSQGFPVDRASLLVLPAATRASLRTGAAASRVAILGFGEGVLQRVVRTYRKLGLSRERFDRWLARPELLPRTVWVHEIVHRYVFERNALGESGNLATRFLEAEVPKEIYFLFRDRDQGADRAALARRYSPSVERALAWVEAHLFEPARIPELAARSGASESTLLRSFRRELGCTPGAYWRTRRLEESMVFLRQGDGSVAEIATRVGYDNPTAFAHAFRLRFGKPPSSFQPRRPTRRAP